MSPCTDPAGNRPRAPGRMSASVAAVIACVLLLACESRESSPDQARLETFVAAGKLNSQTSFLLPSTTQEGGPDPEHTVWVRTYFAIEFGSFEVVCGSTRLFAELGYRFTILDHVPMLGQEVDFFPELDRPSSWQAAPETDVTGDGVPEILVMEYTGGAHCCANLFICEIWPKARLHRIGQQDNMEGRFVQADADAALEIELVDWTFHYWWAAHTDSPWPRVMLKFDGSGWKPCAALMRAPIPEGLSAEGLAKIWRAEQEGQFPASATGRFVVPWGVLLDLIYTGHAREAWEWLDRAWPRDASSREAFRAKFLKQLRRSPYWSTLVELNGAALEG